MSVSKRILQLLLFVAAVLSLVACGEGEPATANAAATVHDANTVGESVLGDMPHMTPDLAAEVTAARPFSSVAELDALLATRLDETERAEVYRTLFVPIDLNSAPKAHILLIPGVDDRMAHEFEEYRPYTGMDEFRKEIGKYVDDAEVARLARYVTLNP